MPRRTVSRSAGASSTPLELSLDDLRREFPVHRVAATLLCAGNRREELNAVEAVAGTTWQQGAVGNAEWTGVRLADILARAGAATRRPARRSSPPPTG